MEKQRYINTRFWHDNFIRENLNPLDRYLFLYFLTNDKTNIAGAYELPLSIIASETGLESELIIRMLKRLKGKIYYFDGWVIIKNFIKHQDGGEKINAGIKNCLVLVPPRVMEKILKLDEELHTLYIGYGYPPNYHNHNHNHNQNIYSEQARNFSFKDKLNDLLASNRRDLQIIGLYWKHKDFVFENEKQYQAGLKRELRPAKALVGYTDEQIMRVLDFLKGVDFKWTLETIHKYINEKDLKKFNKSGEITIDEVRIPDYAKKWQK